MKLAINLTTKTIIDILPDNATDNNKYLINNGYRLLELDNPYNEDGSFVELTDEHLKTFALEIANSLYESSVASLTASVPDSEILTWTKQEQEARGWLVDSSVSTPLIDGILSVRTKYTKAELVEKIISKADAYAAAIGALTGARQAEEDKLEG